PRQPGSAEPPGSAGAPERNRQALLLRHREPRLAGSPGLCVEGIWRGSPRGRQRLPGAARVRNVPPELLLPARLHPAGGGRRQDPPPQRPDHPGPSTLAARVRIDRRVAAAPRTLTPPSPLLARVSEGCATSALIAPGLV